VVSRKRALSWLQVGVPLVGFCLLASGSSAQEQTASIVGVVRDDSGAVVPGARVTVARGGGLSVHVETNGEGRFRFPALAPGVYEVVAELSGFAPARVAGIALHLGQRLDVDVTVSPAGASETVRVVAESPLIAVTQSARATSLRAEEIEKLPNGRDFTDLVGQVAGANLEPDRMPFEPVSIDGSSGAENRFVVDGAEATDLVFGWADRPVAPDFLDEIQVKSSGYTPEYGGSTGGVVNAITKSGSNVWHWDALAYWGADWLDAADAPTLQLDPDDSTRAEHVTFPKDDSHSFEPGFTLGGPVLRDRLWLFAGYIPRFEPVRRTAPFADGTTGTRRQYRKTDNAVANVTGQLGSHWRFRASYNLGRVTTEGQLQQPNGTSAADAAYDSTWIQPGWSLSASVDWTPNASFYTSLRAAYALSDDHILDVHQGDQMIWRRSSIGVPGVPPQYQQPGGYQNVPDTFGTDRQRMGRLAVQWDSTLFFSGAGRHQLSGGVQLHRRTFDVLLGHTGNVNEIFWDQAFAGQRGAFGYYSVVSNPVLPNRGFLVIGEGRLDDLGLFVQDAWTIGDRLTLNLGVRTENEHVPSLSRDPSVPETAIHFGFGDKLAPRLGFAWDATGDGQTKLYGSWGLFYDITKLRMPTGYGAEFFSVSFYTLESADLSRIQDNPACPPECPGRLILHNVIRTGTPINDPDNTLVHIDPGLEPTRLQEAVIGVEREIGPDLSLSARYVHKQLDRAVENVGVRNEAGARSYVIANPGFGEVARFVPDGGTTALPYPRARRDYDALEIGLHRRMANGWGGRFSYVWSRLHGNYSGLANSDFGDSNANFSLAFNSPLMSFDQNGQPVYGPLGTDRPHQIKAQLVRDFGFGTTVGVSWFGASGIPITRWVRFTPGFFFPVFVQGRESDGRMPFMTRLDLQLQHRIRLSDRLRLTLSATAFNVLDQSAATDAWSSELFPGQAVALPEADFFQGFDTQAMIEQQGLATDPRFLLDRTFQAPRTIRLAARLSF